MPRNNRSFSSSSSSSSRSSRPAMNQAPQRPASTAVAPPAAAAAPQVIHMQQPAGPGLMTSIAANAASIAIGHTAAHAISGLFSGSSSSPAVDASPSNNNATSFQQQYPQCQADMQRFLDCMGSHNEDLAACQSFFEMMKNCQKMYSA